MVRNAAAPNPAPRPTAPPHPVPCDADRLARGYIMESGYRPPRRPERTAH